MIYNQLTGCLSIYIEANHVTRLDQKRRKKHCCRVICYCSPWANESMNHISHHPHPWVACLHMNNGLGHVTCQWDISKQATSRGLIIDYRYWGLPSWNAASSVRDSQVQLIEDKRPHGERDPSITAFLVESSTILILQLYAASWVSSGKQGKEPSRQPMES